MLRHDTAHKESLDELAAADFQKGAQRAGCYCVLPRGQLQKPPVTGDTQSILCPTTSMMRVRSGENDMWAPPIIVSAKGCGSPPLTDIFIVADFSLHVQRKTTPAPSGVQQLKQ